MWIRLSRPIRILPTGGQKSTGCAGLKPWETLDIPLEMNETEHALVQLGAAPVKTDTVQMTADVQAAAPSVIVQEVSKDKQQKYYTFICLKEEKEQLLEALRPYNFSAVTLADQKGTATEAMHRYEKEIEKNIELKNVYKEKRTAHYDIRPYEDLRSDENGRCANVYDISITSAIPLILNHIHTQTDQVED